MLGESKDNKSLNASRRRMMMAEWLDMTWGLLRLQEDFIRKTFVNTVLISKNGYHGLKLARLTRAYNPTLVQQ